VEDLTFTQRRAAGRVEPHRRSGLKVLPPQVSVTKIADVGEGGTTGHFRVTRTGYKSGPLAVNLSVGGTDGVTTCCASQKDG